jgi:IS5 family transposase
VSGDQAYRWQTEVIHQQPPQAKDCTHLRYRYKDCLHEAERAKNRTKSSVRSKVEHVFGVMKLKFGKVRYRGLAKDANRLFATCALVILLWFARNCCARWQCSTASNTATPGRMDQGATIPWD